jgi:hypothetical protein
MNWKIINLLMVTIAFILGWLDSTLPNDAELDYFLIISSAMTIILAPFFIIIALKSYSATKLSDKLEYAELSLRECCFSQKEPHLFFLLVSYTVFSNGLGQIVSGLLGNTLNILYGGLVVLNGVSCYIGVIIFSKMVKTANR